MTRRFVLIGDPVAHSRSPALYRAAFAVLGAPATYGAVRVPAERPDLVRAAMIEAAGRGGGNVTLPHKGTAAAAAQRLTAPARRTRAANCFWLDESGRLAADNTDVEGFRLAAGEFPGLVLAEAVVLLIGAGGAARAVALACVAEGARRIDVLNRTPERTRDLLADVGVSARARAISSPARSGDYDLVVNATSLGLRPGDPLPISFDEVRARFAIDLVYGPGGTNWTAHARSHGVAASDGTSMLIQQALLSLQRWFGPDLPRNRLLSAMREAGGLPR